MVGPVAIFQMLTQSRRWQSYAARVLFLLPCLCVLPIVYQYSLVAIADGESIGLFEQDRLADTSRFPAMFGYFFFIAMVIIQHLAIILFAPPMFGGLIAQERERKPWTTCSPAV